MSKEKKQFLVMGVLVLVVVAVGAFQFLGGKPKVAVKTDKKPTQAAAATDSAQQDPKADVNKYIVAMMTPADTPRDPFTPQAVIIDEPAQQQGQGTHIPPPGSVGQNPQIEINGQGVTGPIHPDVTGIGDGHPGIEATNGDPFVLRGVMIGRQNMAIIENSNKEQQLVWEGQSVGHWTVVAISDHEVVLNNNGKVLKLALAGGN